MIWIVISTLIYVGTLAYMVKTIAAMRRTRLAYHEAIVKTDLLMVKALTDMDAQLTSVNAAVADFVGHAT